MARLRKSHARAMAAAQRLAADGRPAKACAHLRKALAAEEAAPPFLRAAARFLHDHGDAPGARSAADTCLERLPHDPEAQRLRCLMTLEDGDAAAAAHALAALLALRAAPDPFRTVAEAGMLRLQGRAGAARARLAPLLAQDPRNLDALRADLLCQAQMGAAAEAADRMTHLRATWPASAPALAALACQITDATAPMPQPDTAIPAADPLPEDPATLRAQLSAIRALRPDWVRPYWALARLELEQGNPLAALEAIATAPDHVSDSATLLPVWTRALLALGRVAEAAALAARTDATGRGGWRSFYMRARIAATKGDRAAEAAALRAGLQRYPGSTPLVNRLIRSCLETQVSPDAMGNWQRLYTPGNASHMLRLESETSLKQCDFERALTLLRRPQPEMLQPVRARFIAQALAGQNRDLLASRYLRRALRQWPSDKRLMDEYLRILLRRDRVRAAMKAFRQFDYADRHGPVAAAEQRVLLHLRGGQLKKALKALDVLQRADRLPWARLPFLLRMALAEGDDAAAARLAGMIDHDPRSMAEQAQKTLHGQMLSEYRLLGAVPGAADGAGSDPAPAGAMTPVNTDAPDALVRLAGLVTAAPASNIAAMRLLRHWTRPEADIAQPRTGTGAPIPPQLFQYWDDPAPPSGICRMVESWQRLPGHAHHLLDRPTALARLRAGFGPQWVQAFLRASKVAEESDFLRLCLLARDGGIYADTDDMVTGKPRSLARLIHAGAGLVVYVEPAGAALGNNFIAAAPGHPAIVLAARQARQALLMRANETAWSKTGPGLLSRAVALYIAREVLAGRVPDVAVIPRARVLRHVSFHNRLPYKATATHWKNSVRSGEAAAVEALLHDLLAPRQAA